MTKNDKTSSLAALLGIVLGVLGTILFFNFTAPSRKFDGNYSRWQKLNLILEQVQRN